ncbi:MAG: anthranilate synthase component I family protein [Campylobacteraceae bacterium]|nr:anthranilate synthase component I family protein [Campylobacteraceae bacterium]
MQNFEELKQLSCSYKTVPVYKIIPQNRLSPTRTFKILKNISRHCFILESLEDEINTGRYTFLGYNPKLEISCKDGAITIKSEVSFNINNADPKEYIQKIIDDNKAPKFDNLPPFTGGLVGYFSYDFIKYSEKNLKLDGKDIENFKDVDLMFFDQVIAFDNLKKEIFLIINIKTDALEKNYNNALDELKNMENLIKKDEKTYIPKLKLTSPFNSLFDETKYCAMVEKAKNYIKEGDIFQVVLSNRFDAEAEGSLFETYEILRKLNPSPYMFYFSSDMVEIAGASPETLVKLDGKKVSTFPLAGTRTRGRNKWEDKLLEEELLRDPKELCEHNMLVDLGRNDIGKISRFGSVKVQKYLSVVRFSHVMHIGSTVEGEIREDKNAIDAIDAVLPAGTLSGAPKIRACEIIHELEGSKRGIYGGAIGYISFTGDMDTCIAIRIAFKKSGRVYVRSGAGIVADSIAKNEFMECENKAKAVINALMLAAGVGVVKWYS